MTPQRSPLSLIDILKPTARRVESLSDCEKNNDKMCYFHFKIVEQKTDENQDLVLKHVHFTGTPNIRKLSAMAEEIRVERTG
ncbi:hypothetical protein VTN00DRAFT_8440 [Thermoascus crustaceus]|uniref:uncharacterized protein n=1 Tax=Thermoascus crustaceus TaxID=5088 RepID=UPI003742713F